MATKTIVTGVTLHVPGKKYVPYKYDENYGAVKGVYHVVAHKPGAEVELDADEADAILARFGGREVVPDLALGSKDVDLGKTGKLP